MVNTTTPDLQLSAGGVSGAIYKKAGPVIMTECKNSAPNGIQHGQIVATSAGKINVRAIFHGSCGGWDGGQGKSEKVFIM